MTQLRKIVDTEGREWSVPPGACMVKEHPERGGIAEVIVGHGFGPQQIYVRSRERVEYILTMRDPRKHCDPLPGWMARPDGDDLCLIGASARRDEVRLRDLVSRDSEREAAEAGWNGQHQIAIDFYDAHVVGYNRNGD